MNKQKIIKQNSVKSDIRIIDALIILDKLSVKTLLVHSSEKFIGTLTDGDIRRGFINEANLTDSINSLVNKNPKIIKDSDFHNGNFSNDFDQLDIIPVIKNHKISDLYLNFTKNSSKDNKLSLSDKCSVIVMAGGKGTRMKPLTELIPKPLVPLHGKTLIEHVFNNFENFGITNFSVSVNYKFEQIIKYFEDKSHKYDLTYIHEEKEMGTIGAIQGFDFNNQPAFITNCDSLIDIDFYDMYKFHQNNKFDFTIAGCEDIIHVPYGVCSVNENMELINIKEKPQIVNLINSGLYLCNQKAASLIPKNTKFDTPNLIDCCLKENLSVGVYKFKKNQWRDIGVFSEYLSYL